jgi:hypothetical protein
MPICRHLVRGVPVERFVTGTDTGIFRKILILIFLPSVRKIPSARNTT